MVVRVSGDVDLATAPRLRASLLDLAGRGHRNLELDLRLVDFLDSSGIGVLLGALRRARLAGGSLRIAACGDELRRLLSLLDLEAAFGLDGAGRP